MEIIASESLLFVGVAILVIVHICLAKRAYRTEVETGDVPDIKGVGMNLQNLQKLPCFEYKHGEKENSATTTDDTANSECAICLENFEIGDNCKMLPICHHYFHVHCVDVWLSKSPSCPICRTCTAKLPPKVASHLGEVGSNVPSTNYAAEELC